MINRTTFTAVAVNVIVLSVCITSFAIVDTRAIEDVRTKSVLNQDDLKAIDTFVADAVNEILRTREDEFATISKTRAILLSRSTSQVDNQVQYAQQFSESCVRHIRAALTEAATLPEPRDAKVSVNLLITAEALNDPAMVDLALPRLTDNSTPISYWATRIVTSKTVVDMINQPNVNPKARAILQTLNQEVAVAAPDALALIVSFAAQIRVPESEALLLAIADRRIADYTKGLDAQAPLDTMILKGLCAKLKSETADKTQCAQRFAQLYSYVIQRYAKAQAQLTDLQKQDLISIIAEVEDKCVSLLLGQPQSGLRRAIEREDPALLMEEHDKLLGSSSQEGRLPALLRFAYKTADGNTEQSFPLVLNSLTTG